MNYDHEGKPKIPELLFCCEQKNYLVFYKNDFIAISLGKSFIKSTTKELKNKFKNEELNFFGRFKKIGEFWDSFSERFLYMSKEEISETFSDVIEMNYSDIKKYWLLPFVKNGDSDNEDKLGDLNIKNKAMKIKIVLEHKYAVDTPEYQQLIQFFEINAVNGKGHIEK